MIILQSSAFIVEIQKDTETTVASMVDKSCRTTVTATSLNRWLFSGKRPQSFLNASIPLLEFGVRMYNLTIARWITSDPMSEKYHSISPYAYWLGNPVIFIDPNCESTWVTREEDGTFIVTDKGDPFDNDSNIYVTYEDDNGVWQRGESIGQTVSPYAFYNFGIMHFRLARSKGGFGASLKCVAPNKISSLKILSMQVQLGVQMIWERSFCITFVHFRRICIKFMQILTKVALISCNNPMFH